MDTLALEASALWRILAVSLLLGAGLPALFAVGIRASNAAPPPFRSMRSNTTRSERKPIVEALAMLLAIAVCAAMCARRPVAAV